MGGSYTWDVDVSRIPDATPTLHTGPYKAARFVLLSDALDGLNGALYSETGQHWQGEELWKAIRSIPATEREQDLASEPSSLPPLYPK